MKKNQFSACLCSGMLLLSGVKLLPVHAEASGLHTGHFSSYAQYETASAAGQLMAANESVAAEMTETLPSSFDLRSKGLVSSVKAQKNYGMCWSFSAVNSMENHLIARKPEIDLSEWHLAYYTYSQKFGFPLSSMTDMDDVFQQGGNYYLLSPMLTGWTGPVSEAVFPFDDYDVLNPEAEWDEVKAQAEYHVSDANLFSYDIEDENFSAQLNAVKQAIYHGNALSVSYYNHNSYYNSSRYAYYNYENKLSGGTYHAVSVVGWDDAFPAENFKNSPEQDGAWLIKNSWGESWGDCGYFWISYYDPTMLEFYYLETESVTAHDALYQYDDYGFWTALSVSTEDKSAYIANVFTAEKDTFLTSVMLCTTMPEEEYSIRIYTNPTKSTNPASGTASASTVGTAALAGYHTVDLTEPVALHEGEKFSIVVKLSGTSGQHIPCESFMESHVVSPEGAVSTEQSMLTEEMILRDFHQGESFYSANGRTWYDVYDEEILEEEYTAEDGSSFSTRSLMGNICLRGLTKDAGTVIFSEDCDALPVGTEITLSSPGSSEIWYSTNGGEYQLYTEPLVMPEQELQISAYAVVNPEDMPVVCEKNYTVQEAQISSLLAVQNQKQKYYLSFRKTEEQKYETEVSAYSPDEMFALMPISTGEIMSDGEWLVSGKITQVYPDKNGTVVLSVSQEGMLDTVYEIHFPVEEPILYGDADNDGKVNAADAADVLVYAAAVGTGAEPELPDENWLLRADYNADGDVNAYDASEILVYAAQQGTGSIDE